MPSLGSPSNIQSPGERFASVLVLLWLDCTLCRAYFVNDRPRNQYMLSLEQVKKHSHAVPLPLTVLCQR